MYVMQVPSFYFCLRKKHTKDRLLAFSLSFFHINLFFSDHPQPRLTNRSSPTYFFIREFWYSIEREVYIYHHHHHYCYDLYATRDLPRRLLEGVKG